ncbi:hypothetical protein HYC85_028866 [Camellia sinensis]|uniref:Secreted protein n=1 Tax=Camellia sinensis TaxID=4442 RepID=A0A7J7FWG5_CAMSI|nr:hypothetical protein HYC85_028866 [Camellia sinensis]
MGRLWALTFTPVIVVTFEFCQRGATVDTPFLTVLKTWTSPLEHLGMPCEASLHITGHGLRPPASDFMPSAMYIAGRHSLLPLISTSRSCCSSIVEEGLQGEARGRGYSIHAQAQPQVSPARPTNRTDSGGSARTARAKKVALEQPLTFFTLRSSEESCIRARTLFSTNLAKKQYSSIVQKIIIFEHIFTQLLLTEFWATDKLERVSGCQPYTVTE